MSAAIFSGLFDNDWPDEEEPNLVRWIERAANGEPVEAVVIGKRHDDEYDERDNPTPKIGCLLSWEEAKPIIDYRFHAGCGGADCHAVFAWTKSWVIFVSKYDGSTDIARVPRNPVACVPCMFGGGG